MHKGQYKGLLEGSMKGTRLGLSTGLAKGLYSNSKFKKKHVFWILGDSIAAGTTGGAVVASSLPIPGTAFEYERLRNVIVPFGKGFVSGIFANNAGSPWATFSRLYYKEFGISPVIVNMASGSSTISTADNANDWTTTGTNWNVAKEALKRTLQLVPNGELKAVMVNVGINDVQGLNATSGLTVAQIKTNLYDFINRIIAFVGPNIPILFNTLGRATTLVVSAKLSGVRDAFRSACIDYRNVYIAATLSSFSVSFYYHDNIHPSGNGNDQLGRAFCRWFRNSKYTKWARSIICCHDNGVNEGDIFERDKQQIQAWITKRQTEYLQMEWAYFSMGRFQYGTGYNAAFDWAFMSAPAVYGDFTVGGTYPNQYVQTVDSADQFFDNGNQQNLSMIYANNTDAQCGINIIAADTPLGTAATAFGASNLFLSQQNPSGTQFNIFGSSSDSGPDAKIQPARYVLARGGGNIVLYKNGVAVSGGVRANGSLATQRTSIGMLNATSGRFAGKFTEYWMVKNSFVTDLSTWLTDLDALFAT